MRVHRLISILLMVESRGKIKAKVLAEKLETSVRTIYRDIDILCEAGIPLTSSTGPNGGVHFIEGYSIGLSDLKGEDMINLYLSGIGIQPDNGSDMGMKLNNALIKLEKNLPSKYGDDIKKIKQSFHFDDSPWWGESTSLGYMDSLINAVWKSMKLRITYEKAKGVTSERTIRPYGIVVKRMEWYMVAYDEEKNDIRTFKCERIIKIDEIKDVFTIPENFSIDDYWNKSKMVFKNICRQNEYYPLDVKIHKSRADILNGLEILEIKQDKHYVIATINMHKYEFACEEVRDVLGYGEILRPSEMREFVKNELNNLILKYEE
ncbi:helix-turn-helix transcriptional regulator [Oceanirhabdus seepicola]|uniref:YafY family transcriptional regulator n=1 Tax=Oceanirhabdus seepicola TaxID=2828781 RepID=A0A9J6P9S1_9CLOT|nr:YafY family protein [Oceanirhabdus seepicola]MCM1992181.1 YafY family transcriptional regulator [Oceanirhabdus seepicola]